MKKHLSTIVLVLVLLCGLAIMLYPVVSDYVSTRSHVRQITSYTAAITQQKDYSAQWEAARAFNETLSGNANRFYLTKEQREAYNQALNVSGTGVMGYIKIPKIDVSLPVYHGTSDAVLQAGVGHIEGTSLPTGDVGTHIALSGHRGLPSATLFTNLDRLGIGDAFTLKILDQTLTYEVDQILVVLPNEMDALAIDPSQEYCTLITCTPYGVNSHRLLVRGHRVEVRDRTLLTDAQQVDKLLVAFVVAVPLLLFMVVWLTTHLCKSRTTKRKER